MVNFKKSVLCCGGYLLISYFIAVTVLSISKFCYSMTISTSLTEQNTTGNFWLNHRTTDLQSLLSSLLTVLCTLHWKNF